VAASAYPTANPMFRRISLSVLLLALLMTQGAAAVCQLKCAEVEAPGLTKAARVHVGMQHCQHMTMPQQDAVDAPLQILSDCSSHLCTTDLSALSQEKFFAGASPIVLETIALLPADSLVLPTTTHAMQPLRPKHPILPSALADPLTTSLRV
jgi:hypothetical protein